MNARLSRCLVAATFAVVLSARAGSVGADYHQLQSLPSGKAPAGRVINLTVTLVQRDPDNAAKYLRTAARKFAKQTSLKIRLGFAQRVTDILTAARSSESPMIESDAAAVDEFVNSSVRSGYLGGSGSISGGTLHVGGSGVAGPGNSPGVITISGGGPGAFNFDVPGISPGTLISSNGSFGLIVLNPSSVIDPRNSINLIGPTVVRFGADAELYLPAGTRIEWIRRPLGWSLEELQSLAPGVGGTLIRFTDADFVAEVP